MDLKDQGRREPTMADLEAFERLLRESLQPAQHVSTPASAAPLHVSPAPRGLDASAMAELTRLIEAPLPFDIAPDPAVASTFEPVAAPTGAEPMPPQPAIAWQQLEAIPPSPASVEARVVAPRLQMPSEVPPAHDPLLAFEEELRRFDRQAAEPVTMVAPSLDLRGEYPGHAQDATILQPAYSSDSAAAWQGEAGPATADPQSNALAEAERRLSAEAAVAAAAAGAAAGSSGRSKRLFFGLAGVAVVGAGIITASLALGGRKPTINAGVPVVAAKQEPTKERPANPGGVEIPDQNRQVLAPRAAAEPPKPAQAVNTTEQPVDLNQAVRRESVRVVAPSPFQGPQTSAPTTPPPADSLPAPAASAPTPAPAPAVESEPRRVQSVVLGDPARAQPVPQPTSPGIAAAGAATIAAIAAGASRPATTSAPVTPPSVPRAVTPPPAALPQTPATPPAAVVPAPPKVEARPQSVVTTAPTPRPAQPAPTPRPAAAPPAPRSENAPLSLTNSRPPQQAAAQPRATPAPAPAASGSGGWSVQIASRASADEARAASTQLGGRFSSALGRTTTVTSGEANGRTVYRVRAQGYSQAEANAACERVKAAGGQCFVTR